MMKLSKEERTALKTERSKFKTLLLLILLSEFIFPQIPFKGFCKFNSFQVDSGFTRIFSLNYDENEYSDLLIYSPSTKTAEIFDGSAGLKFNTGKKITFPLEVSVIEPIIPPDKMIEMFAFTSRKNRSFGIYKFNKNGIPTLQTNIKLDSYPENISVASNPLDDNYEFLISGNSYNGLSIISKKNNRLEQKRIIDKNTFQNAKFIDLNSDGVQDIVALSSTENKLHFIFNNYNDKLEDLRQLEVGENVLTLQVFDINYDGFKDIIISTTVSIKIYFGDSFASFNNTSTISTTYQADKFAYGDFNRDGFFDFNYLNIENGIVSTIFAKDFYTYYPELIQRQEIGIVDVIPFYSKFVYGTAYLNVNGIVSILSKVKSIAEDQHLAVAVNPSIISTFDNSSNGIKDLVYKDDFDGSLKFIIRDAAGLPDKIFAVKLFENSSDLNVMSRSKNVKKFFLFSYGKRVIESIEVNFNNFTFKREYFYAEGSIEDIVVIPDASDEPEIYILSSRDGALNLEVLFKNQLKYSRKMYKNLAKNYLSPFLLSIDPLAVKYWSTDKKDYVLNSVLINNDGYKIKADVRVKNSGQLIVSKVNDGYNMNNIENISLLISENDFFVMQDNILSKKISTKSLGHSFRITGKNQLFFGKNNALFVFTSDSKSVYKITPLKNKKDYSLRKIFPDIELNNFTIQNLDQRNMHLIYSDTKNGLLEIRQLPK